MMMAETIQELGYTVYDVDLREADAATLAEYKELMYVTRFLVFKHQEMTTAEYVRFAGRLGTPIVYLQEHYRHPIHPEIFVSSDEGEGDRSKNKLGMVRAGDYWHADGTYLPRPYPLTMLYPRRLPESQQRTTWFVDMSEVYDALGHGLRTRILGLRAYHDGKWRYRVRAQDAGISIGELLEAIERIVPPALHPMVTVHPVTGERILYVSRGYTTCIPGLSLEESDELLNELFDFSERDEFVHRHVWETGDLVIWDNRTVLHRVGELMEPGEYSTMFRITVDDGMSLYDQEDNVRQMQHA